ncbi:putative reticulocalbin calumenin dna supercoiling factor [Fasciolopsis buskii]|uniref:Reticulocalbin-3 n=1 Tax=Fasciolopsis buskii TaxID=27845 RepID=A0A8E0S3Z5_9TREM|nr:putative reticulocalbin calumenin dna supercoiling factor [Fasciolopsis buski]
MVVRCLPTFAIFCYISLILSAAGPTNAHKERVFEKLSSAPHDHGGEHNIRYDQEAFLGEDAESFLRLTPEKGKEELGKIFHKIDINNDGMVTMDELVHWLEKVHNRTIASDIKHSWEAYKLQPGEPLTWEVYSKHVIAESADSADDDEENVNATLERDRRRWDACKNSGDDRLLYTDASCFLHPELHDKMKKILAQETVEEIDKNKDGFISEDEYISDMWSGEKGESEPEWVKSEREEFHNKRDTNKDGKLDVQEVYNWIFPSVDDPIKTEADHLMQEVDVDGDGRLDKNEMLSRYDFLAGHQVTNFGEILGNHDEL